LALMHPVTRKAMSWTSAIPEDMANLIEALRAA